MSTKKAKRYSPEFKAKVALEALKKEKSLKVEPGGEEKKPFRRERR